MLRPGELIRLRCQADPATAELRVAGAVFTVANGCLEQRRKGWLAAVLTVPMRPGDYAYEWWSDGAAVKTGVLRVRAGARRPRAIPQAQPAPRATYRMGGADG